MRVLLVLCVLLPSTVLLAQPRAPRATPPRVVAAQPVPAGAPVAAPARVQRLTFDDDVVTGGRDLGDGDVIRIRPPIKHLSLVRARDSFVPELIKSAEDL